MELLFGKVWIRTNQLSVDKKLNSQINTENRMG